MAQAVRGICQGGWVVYTGISGGSSSPGDLVRGTKWDVVHVKGGG